MADQLDVAEVAGGERVGFAAAEEAEALDRPGADFGDREEAGVRVRRGDVAVAAGDRDRQLAERHRAGAGEVHRLQFGRGAAGDHARRRDVAAAPPSPRRGGRPSGRRCGARSSPRGSPRSAARRPPAASASQGQSRRAGRKSGRRRMIGPTSGSRRKRWWKALMSSSTPSAKRIRSIAVASSSRPAGSSSSQTGGTVRRAGSTASARKLDPARARLPGAHEDRPAVDLQQPRRDPARRPAGCGRSSRGRSGTAREAGPRPRAERAPPRGATGRAGGRRPGRSGWRSPCRDGGDATSRRGPLPREPTAEPTTRTAATVAAPASTPPARRRRRPRRSSPRRAAPGTGPRAPAGEACGPGRRRPRRRRLPRRRSPHQGGGRSPNPR